MKPPPCPGPPARRSRDWQDKALARRRQGWRTNFFGGTHALLDVDKALLGRRTPLPPLDHTKSHRLRRAALTVLALLAYAAGCQPRPPVEKPPVVSVREGDVQMRIPNEPLYIGSYLRIPYRIDPHSGIKPRDLVFSVLEGEMGGVISDSIEAGGKDSSLFVMLIAGYRPGVYTLLAQNKATDAIVGKMPFKTTVQWHAAGDGPSFVHQGMTPSISAGTAWGGGPAGRQNSGTIPASGTRRVAIIFVETDEQAFPTGAAFDAIRQNWLDNIINGVDRSGTTFSLRRYYQEASQNTLDFTAQAFGPYSLGGDWDTVGGGVGWFAHIQAGITAADADVDYTQFDSVLIVSQTVDATATEPFKMAWPIASIGETSAWVTGDGSLTIGGIQMPVDWTARDGREVYETASHEMGHNLGMVDQYTPTVAGRNPGAWELMHADRALPEFTLAHKLMLGWVDPSTVGGFDFASSGTNIDETITLVPAAGGAPTGGKLVGAEVRIADGYNYYFEFRHSPSTRIADRELPEDNRILLTDVVSGPFVPSFSRPTILLGPTIPPSAGPVLENGETYQETDNTAPTFPVEFKASASNFTGSAVDLRIQYGINGKPDPSIRPWDAPPWQSPDIEVRNERNAADPVWFNVPWQANPNTVVAKVKNGGNVSAPDVTVNFYVKDFTVGGAPESFLGTDTQDIGPGATVEFTTSWTPPSNGHYCIVARIPLYQTPAPARIVELTEFNNVAQSNYDRFISPTGSPSLRQHTQIIVRNPYGLPARVYLDVRGTNPLYRTYLGNKWVDLGPNERRSIEVLLEYVGTTPGATKVDDRVISKLKKLQNHVSLKAVIQNPHDPTGHNLVLLGGAGLSVATGHRTAIQDYIATRNGARGTVVTSDGKPVPGGQVIMTFEGSKGRTNARVRLSRNGQFTAPVPEGTKAARAYYLPPPGFGDATTDMVPVR